MSAVLSFDLKPCMSVLCAESRWNVLSVLLLHTNIRNRCYIGMDTVAEMATNGNLNKATAAKKWLELHGVFELVPFAKRVGEEKDLPRRQHVYQLTGVLRKCEDAACNCQKWARKSINYLYHGTDAAASADVIPVENIGASDVIPVENFNRAKVTPIENIQAPDVIPIENIDGENVSNKENLSIYNRRGSGAAKTPATARIAQIEKHPVWQAYVRGWDGIVVKVDPRLAEVTFNAVQQLQADIDNGSATLADIEGTTRWKLSQTRKLRYLITYVGPDIQDYQAFRRASSGKPARASPPPVVPAAQSLTPEDIARRMAEKERILATAGAR